MSLVVNFSASQTIGLPSKIVLTDSSTGSDGSVTKRRVYLTKVDSTTLVPSGTSTTYVDWGSFPGTTTITIDALDKDYALSVKVDWLDVSNNILYTKTYLIMFSLYNETFYYGLTQAQSSNPSITSNKNYYESKMKLRVELDSAAQAVSFASDQFSAQGALDRATNVRLNTNLFQ
jgi:hypothetical protein